MYQVLSKDIIENEIIPHLPVAKRGFKTKSSLVELVNCILYKLKTGVQWAYLPVKQLFSEYVLHYKTVFNRYRQWCKSGSWEHCWIMILSKYKSLLDLSSCDIDGSHTKAIKGGEEVGYQKRKKSKTTNAIYLTDRQGIPIAMSIPVSGNHNDLFEIEKSIEQMSTTLELSGIPIEGLFVNADAGFYSKSMFDILDSKEIIPNIAENRRNGSIYEDRLFDPDLYQERYSVERTNAWMDAFRSLLNRFDIKLSSWVGFNYISFIVIGLRKFKKSR
jgi:transposase